ncbi:MAG: hypothetical protein NVV74_05535 [Magnetospirillum sp.]|nr:hypothetical protein [Magnetospirillum sp.]
MGRLIGLALLLAALPAAAQEQQQQARAPAEAAGGGAVYDMVAGDRETAWRINRVTGEIVICRVDTTGSLDSARARCSPAVHETGPQQSRAAPEEGRRP